MKLYLMLCMAAVMVISEVAGAQSQPKCKGGSTITITGGIERAYQAKLSNGWGIIPREQGRGECLVDELWGDGRLPAGCTQGRSFRASGKYDDDSGLILAELESVLRVRRISCK